MANNDVLWNLFTSFLDILSVSIIIYVFAKLLSKSKKNVLILLVLLGYGAVYFIAHLLHLQTLSFLLAQVYTWGVIIIVILFQSEIRSSIQKISSFNSLFSSNNKHEDGYLVDFVEEMRFLADHKIGALVALSMDMNLSQYTKNAISINGDFSKYLIQSIFMKDSPLHDGAVIIKDGKIECASAYFPIAIDLNIDQKFGTRHRAGLTLSRETDAIVVIVSEESGEISIAYHGQLIDGVENDFLLNFIKEKMED